MTSSTKALAAPARIAGITDEEILEGEARNIAEAARRRKVAEWSRRFLLPLLGILLFILAWGAYAQIEGVTLPGPLQTLRESWTFIAHPFFDNGANDKGLGWHVLASLSRVGQGYLLAALTGVSLGLLVGHSMLAHRALDPVFQVLRTIPPLAWLPLSLATFNRAGPSAVFVIFITALWPIVINTAVGVQRVPADYKNVARLYQLRGFRYLFRILIPAAAPYIFTGLRVSIGMAWLAIVAAEMLTGGVGIGFFIWDSWNSSRLSDIVVSVFYVGMVGWVLDRAVAALSRRFGTVSD